MTVEATEDGVHLSGSCPQEDAEILLSLLLDRPDAAVFWARCDHLHAAVLQVLLCARVSPRGDPRGAFLREHLAPLLEVTSIYRWSS